MAVRARTFTYAVSLDREWAASSDRGGQVLAAEEAWTPEHLLLAAVARCTLQSLRYHAHQAGLELRSSGTADGTVTRPAPDERYAFVEIEIDLDVTIEPEPERVRELLALAERDCFVGASLAVAPTYRWTVNGQEIA